MAIEGGPLSIRHADADAILARARDGAPREVCGLLVGFGREVVRLVETLNAAARATEYAIPPEAHFAAIRGARRDDLDVIGAYHSHPSSVAEPSARDAETAFESFVFLIAGLTPEPHLRAWTYQGGNFTEVAVVRR